MGFRAFQPPRARVRVPNARLPLGVALPLTVGSVGLALLVWDHFDRLDTFALVSACASVVAVLTILVVTFFEKERTSAAARIARRQSDEADCALRESEREYRLLFDENPNPMWVCDTETFRFLAVNEAAIEKYGYTREEFLAMTILDIRPEEDHEELKAIVSGNDP